MIGVSERQLVLRLTVTLHGAKFLGRDETLGSFAEARPADLALLEADPIEDIDNTKRVNTVVKNGEIIARDELKLPVNQHGAQE
jgi:imidazolonepropionase-like amidohydrolase